MNLSEMRDYIRRVLNEDGESSGFYSDTELNSYINEAYKELVRIYPVVGLGDLYELSSTQSYTSTTGIETLPSDFDRTLYVKYGDVYCTILSYLNSVARNDNTWFTASSTEPTAYFSTTNLYVTPTPSASTTIILGYIAVPTVLSADADEPELKSIFHEFICFGALERAKVKDNEFEEGAYHFNRMKKKIYSYYGQLTPEEQLRR